MVLTKKDLTVKEVNFSREGEEVISVVITDGNQDINIITVYVPPKTSAWDNEQYVNMRRNTIERMREEISKKDKVVLMGDFNCKEVVWEDFEVINGSEWGEELLTMITDNLMTQWVKEPTRCRGEDVPTRLDLMFTKGIDMKEEIEHECPLGKSDHDVLKFRLNLRMDMKQNDEHKEERLNYFRANYYNLRNFFAEIDWSVVYQEEDTQLKYEKFMKMYNDGVEKFVPRYGIKKTGKNQWFNRDCEEAKKNKKKAWKRYKKNNEVVAREEYIGARNRYVEVRRKAQKEYERKIVENCESEPKLFYKFINGKLNRKEVIEKVKVGEEIYEEVSDIVEILNNNFCKVFTTETLFNEEEERVNSVEPMQDLNVTKGDIENIMNNIDVNKSMGPDGISGRVLKECKEQVLGPILDIVKSSIDTGKVPREWKRADIVPIYKSGSKMEPHILR